MSARRLISDEAFFPACRRRPSLFRLSSGASVRRLVGDRVAAVAECVQSAALLLALRLFDRARGRPELPVVEVDSSSSRSLRG